MERRSFSPSEISSDSNPPDSSQSTQELGIDYEQKYNILLEAGFQEDQIATFLEFMDRYNPVCEAFDSDQDCHRALFARYLVQAEIITDDTRNSDEQADSLTPTDQNYIPLVIDNAINNT